MLPHAREPWKQVLELRQLDLDAGLARPRAPAEDVEDESRPVDDLHVELLAEIPALGGGEIVVEKEQRRLLLAGEGAHLVDLALAEERGGPDGPAALHHLAAHLSARGLREETQLRQALAIHGVARPRLAAGQDRALPKRARSPARRGHA